MRVTIRLLGSLSLLAGLNGVTLGQAPSLAELLARKPIQLVTVTTPAAAECRAEAGKYTAPATGTVVKDAQGRVVRQFIDTTGRGRPNLVYFYHDGVEAYREIDSKGVGKPDQFRWLGVNGGKWGGDTDGDGAVDVWYVLSPEELSQEVFAALQTRNVRRLEALLPTAKELQSLGLPAAEVEKTLARSALAAKKMMETAAALNLGEKARWLHVEFGLPSVAAADSFGGRDDLTKQPSALVLYEKGDGKTADVFTVGEMVLLGNGKLWRLIDGPTPGAVQPGGPAGEPGAGGVVISVEAQPWVKKLQEVKPAADAADMLRYHLDRVAILEKVVGRTKNEDQQPWLKQVIDSYAAIVETDPAGAAPSAARLKEWAATINREAPKSGAASYADYRMMGVEYMLRLRGAKENQEAENRKWWREQLESFATRHAGSEEAPEAMTQLAASHEGAGRDGEATAKVWYEKVVALYPKHANAAKAEGAVRRLLSEGQPFSLPNSKTLDGSPFSMAATAGKPTLVFYFVNWSRDPAAERRVVSDLKTIAELAKAFGDKLNVVTVSLDDEPARAVEAINAAGLPGAHLHLPGGLDRSPLAVAYGIQSVPHAFLIDKAGKVVNRNAQSGPALKDEIEKLLK